MSPKLTPLVWVIVKVYTPDLGQNIQLPLIGGVVKTSPKQQPMATTLPPLPRVARQIKPKWKLDFPKNCPFWKLLCLHPKWVNQICALLMLHWLLVKVHFVKSRQKKQIFTGQKLDRTHKTYPSLSSSPSSSSFSSSFPSIAIWWSVRCVVRYMQAGLLDLNAEQAPRSNQNTKRASTCK